MMRYFSYRGTLAPMSDLDHIHCDHDHHKPGKKKTDVIYIGSAILIFVAYILAVGGKDFIKLDPVNIFSHHVFELMNTMWWGLALSIVGVGLLNKIPRELVMKHFGARKGFSGLFKATMAGTLFDLCSHGILVLAMKIYERGATIGQTIAFLIASPWNSFSLSLILYALIGGHLTFLFLILSMVVAIISGWLFDLLVDKKFIPGNHNVVRLEPELQGIQPLRIHWSWKGSWGLLKDGFRDAKPVIKWIFFGTLLSALVNTLVAPEIFASYFGNNLKGTFLTLLAATGIEVCSEGSVPLAADLVNVAHAPGNAFIFLMAGVATDLTEILAIRETTKSWKIALLLPLVTVPQIILLGLLINWDYL